MPTKKRRYNTKKFYTIDDIKEKYPNAYTTTDSIYRGIKRGHVSIKGDEKDPKNWLVNRAEFDFYIHNKQPNQTAVEFPEFNLKDWTDYWTLKGDFAVTADWHLPFYSVEMAKRFIKMCKLFGITKHIIVGDLFDEHAYSRFIDFEKMQWREEKSKTREVILLLLEYFDENYIVMGNHDHRRFKALLGRDDPFGVFEEVCLKEANEKWLSVYNYCIVESGERKWLLVHPDKAGKTNAWLKDLKAKYPTYNIMGAHSHKFMNDQDASADYQMIALPGMQDMKKIGWKMMKIGNDWLWTTGFAIIKNGYAYIYTEKFIDWELWDRIEIKEK